VIPWTQIDRAAIPGGEGELRLMRRDAEFSIMSGSIELMNSRLSGSETALAAQTLPRLADGRALRILIGGLGMGFTLRAALSVLGPQAEVVVAELVPAVVDWARGPMAELFAGSLSDPRTAIHEGDVRDLIAGSSARFDAILLDVDNGPGGVNRAANNALYSAAGLEAARGALRPGGLLAVWSAGPDAAFVKRLGQAGYAVEELKVRAHGNRGSHHVIWIASPGDSPVRRPPAHGSSARYSRRSGRG
jgi:spermidine synthase